MERRSTEATKQTNPPKKNRRYDLDNLRTFLTALVIYHHTAIGYGGPGDWAFHSRCVPGSSDHLFMFNAINQTFFMGLFFYVSAYFTRRTLSSKSLSRATFLKQRLLRLGLPAIFSTLFIEPAIQAMVLPHFTLGDVLSFLWHYWSGLRGIRGPAWYLVLVLIFDGFAAVLGDHLSNALDAVKTSDAAIALLWMVTMALTFTARIFFPISVNFVPLNLRVAVLPGFILAYACGHASAFDCGFVLNPIRNVYRPRLLTAIFLSWFSLTAVVAFSVRISEPREKALDYMMGGVNIPALLVMLWGEFSFALIGPALLDTFSRFNFPIVLRIPWPFSGTDKSLNMSRYNYAIYMCHGLVCTITGLGVDAYLGCVETKTPRSLFGSSGPVLMTALVGSINVMVSGAAACLLMELIPGLASIL